jgi:hypothetical protein
VLQKLARHVLVGGVDAVSVPGQLQGDGQHGGKINAR